MTVLVSGAASGIGRALTDALVRQGHRVVALDIRPIEAEDGVLPFRADVTREEELRLVSEQLRTRGVLLDTIVSAAGVHAMTSLVEGDTDTLRRLMDVNVLGTMLLCRTLHEHLRPRGRVVIVTSEVATLDPLPFNGLYSVSKAALDSYAQALRQELHLLGQTVVTVRPGAIDTPLCRTSLEATAALAASTALYQRQATHFLALTRAFMGRPMPPERLARLLVRIITKRRVRYVYHKHRNVGLVLLSCLPIRLQCAIIRALLNRRG